MIVVSDTSPLSNLLQVNCLWLLQEIYGQLIIPELVAQELEKANIPEIRNILKLEWIQIYTVSDQFLVDKLLFDSGLDAGEANAIALACELNAEELLIDEKLGRREAQKLGIPIIGILGVLVIAKRRKLIPKVKTIIDDLREKAGFRISQALYCKVLQLSEE